ncbi:MAG: LptF/LptG family permease [Rhodospirillales bacterium]
MRILSRYMSRKVVLHGGLVLLSLVALSLTFELMERADNVLAASDGDPWSVLIYAFLRLPDFVARQLPMSVLIGALITFGLLRRYDELIAMWGSGVSALGMMRALLPIGIVIGLFQFVLDDVAVPQAQEMLLARGLGEIGRKSDVEIQVSATWLRSGHDIIRIPKDIAKQGQLRDISVFRRDEAGVLIERLDAASARPVADGWLLSNVTRDTVDPPGREALAELVWQGHIDIDQLPLLSSDQRDLSLRQLEFLIVNEGFGQRPADLYRTWLYDRIAVALTPILCLSLVIALAQRFHRTGDFGYLMFTGLVFGFAFFVLDGATLAMGEAALLPPWFAASCAEIVLVCVIATLTLRVEG